MTKQAGGSAQQRKGPGAEAGAGEPNPIVSALYDMAVNSLSEQLREMFEKADDFLFESARKARAGDEQRLYMDAMNLVRAQRGKIIQAFKTTLRKTMADVEGQSAEDGGAHSDISQWSLQDGDALEERIALNNMEHKAASLNAHELVELKRRLGRLSDLAAGEISAEAMSPLRIIRAFQDSMTALEVDFPVKLVIYKLFDRVVVGRMSEVFVGANQLLAVHGVEPRADLHQKPFRPKPAPRPVPRADLSSTPGGLPSWATSSFDPATLGGFSSGAQAAAAAPGGGAVAVSADEQAFAQDVGQILGAYAQGKRPAAPEWLPPENVALVARMFDGYYRDPRLQNDLKPMLARLQLPMTKAALADDQFFSDRHHPGRRAISALFELLLQSGSAESAVPRSLLDEIRALIESIARTFSTDIADLRQANAVAVQAEVAERFLRDQEELQQIKNKVRVERVRRIVAYELRRRIGARRIDEGVMRLMLSGFGPLLCLDYIRNGIQGASWNQTMLLVDRVLNSLWVGDRTPQQRAAEEADIVATVSRRLTAIGFSEDKLESVIAGLLQVYMSRSQPSDEAGDTLEDAPLEVVERAPEVGVLSTEQELQGIMSILLVPGAWFTVWEPMTQSKHWVRAKSYYSAQNQVLFGHYMDERYLRVSATAFATEIVEGRATAIDPSPEVGRMIERLRELPFDRENAALVWAESADQPVPAQAV